LETQKIYFLSKEIADTIQKQLQLTENLMKSGQVKQSDYLLLKIESENQKLSAEHGYIDFEMNLSELNTLCGLQDSSSVQLSNIDLQYVENKNFSKFLQQFSNDSLLVQNQQSIFETKYSPKISLFFNTGLNAVDLENIERKFGINAGINFSLPIYDGNQKSLTRQQTQISLKTIEAYKENQKIQVSNKIKNANGQIIFYKQNLKNISDQVETYGSMMKIAQMELMKGQRSMVEFITLIKNYLDLKKNYVSSEIDYLKAINQYNYWNW
jgi:outer membrane protein TolC